MLNVSTRSEALEIIGKAKAAPSQFSDTEWKLVKLINRLDAKIERAFENAQTCPTDEAAKDLLRSAKDMADKRDDAMQALVYLVKANKLIGDLDL